MRLKKPATVLAAAASVLAAAALAALALAAPSSSAPTVSVTAPPSFFGVAPQTFVSEEELDYMQAGRIGAMRWMVPWGGVQRTRNSEFDWSGFDQVVAASARRGIRILPFVYGTPRWAANRETTLPIDNARQRQGWSAFLEAAVGRYGPRGEFWREHWAGSVDPVPKVPLREWQIWNEANFFYFAKPASPQRYARLLRLSNQAIKRTDPAAKTVLTGLFAEPNAKPPNGMHATQFLEQLYRVPGIRASFDGVALHPYAESAEELERMIEELRAVVVENRDYSAGLYLTELGWGSDNNPNLVSFEQGVGFQLREMRRAYEYLIANRGRLNLKSTYWFTWKDIAGSCNFCDSTGFFRDSERMKPKPAWRTFVRISGGFPRP